MLNGFRTLLGPTTFCQGLSRGGGKSCMTISAGCFAISPTFNIIPQTTCTEMIGAQPTQPSIITADPEASVTTSSPTSAPEATQTPATDPSLTSSVLDTSQLSNPGPPETPTDPVPSQSLTSDIASADSQISAATSAASVLSSNPTDPQVAQAANPAIDSALQGIFILVGPVGYSH